MKHSNKLKRYDESPENENEAYSEASVNHNFSKKKNSKLGKTWH